MEQFTNEQKETNFYEVKLGVETNLRNIKDYYEEYQSLSFFVTNDFDIYVSHLHHFDIQKKNGLEPSEYAGSLVGYSGGEIKFFFQNRSPLPPEKKRMIEAKILSWLNAKSIRK